MATCFAHMVWDGMGVLQLNFLKTFWLHHANFLSMCLQLSFLQQLSLNVSSTFFPSATFSQCVFNCHSFSNRQWSMNHNSMPTASLALYLFAASIFNTCISVYPCFCVTKPRNPVAKHFCNTYRHTYLPTYWPTYILTCLLTYLLVDVLTYPFTHLITYLFIYTPTHWLT